MPREILGEVGGRPYSPGTRAGNHTYVSGQLGWDESGKIVPGGIEAETRAAIEAIKRVLAKAGASLDDVTMVTVYVTDLAGDYAVMNKIYSEYFGTVSPPARATVEVSKLALNGRVEIAAIAVHG
jgi:reactive intermediate/imine deaminase